MARRPTCSGRRELHTDRDGAFLVAQEIDVVKDPSGWGEFVVENVMWEWRDGWEGKLPLPF